MSAWRVSARSAWGVFWWSRLVVFGVAIWVVAAGLSPGAMPESATLSHPFAAWPASQLLDLVFSPLAKWDAQHYLAIALDGYGQGREGLPPAELRPAFFPLYPGAVRVLSGFGASRGLVLIAAYAVSLACFFGALTLLHRLTALELGDRFARPTLLLFAFFPTAMFFGIPYTESLFALLAIAVFLAARSGRWALTGVLLALASATRVPGLLLLVPAAMLYLYGPRVDREPELGDGPWPRYVVRPDLAWLALAPLGLLAFSGYLGHALGDPLAWNEVQASFGRQAVDPLTGAWAGVRDFGTGLAHLVGEGASGGSDYLKVAELPFVAFAVLGGVGALRRLPAAYGAWVLVSLVPTLVSQPPDNALWSAPRFVAVLFPIFMWLATLTERRGWTTPLVAAFAAGMAVFTVQFSLWSFVA